MSAQDGTTSLKARLSLRSPASEELIAPVAGQLVQLEIALTDAVTGQSPRAVPLQGWVRPVQPGNSSCEQAVRGFLTTGAVPAGSVNLNTSVLAVVSRDGSVGIIDPKLNLMSANMLSAFQLEEPPAGTAVDTARMRILVTQRDKGRVLALPVPGGEEGILVQGLPEPTDIALTDNGDIWVASAKAGVLTRLAPDGRIDSRLMLGGGRVTIRDELGVALVAFSDSGGVRLIERESGAVLFSSDSSSGLSDVAAIGNLGFLTLPSGRAEARLHYLDAVDTPIVIPLGIPFERISVSLDGRFALAWSPGDATFVLIDLALAQVVQPVKLRDATITEARIFNESAYLLSHDGGFVGVIDLATVGLGRPAEITEVRLGVKGDRPTGDTGLLVPLAPSPQLLAVDPVTQTGFVIEAMSGVNGMPPMDATRLRGGIPQKVLVVDRQLEETQPGVFPVAWAFDAGEHEVVLTTGIAGLTSCLRFSVQGEQQARGVMPVRMEVLGGPGAIVAGDELELKLRFFGPDGAPITMPETRFMVPSFKSGWRTETVGRPQADGSLMLQVTLPHPGAFALQPLQMPPHMALRSGVMIEALLKGD